MMAGYMCDSDDGQPADFLFTNLGNGDTSAWCTACVVTFAMTLIESLTPQESPDGVPAAETANLAEKEGEATPSTPGRKRRQARDTAAQATPADDPPADAPDRID